ncbi:hypothetical protein Tco_1184845 [Tanacetum coccineum]
MIVKILGSLVQKVILDFSLVILLIPVLTEFTNRRTKKIMKTMNVTFDKLSAMAFKQSSLKPGLQSMIWTNHYDDHVSGSYRSAAPRTVPAAQAPQVLTPPSPPLTNPVTRCHATLAIPHSSNQSNDGYEFKKAQGTSMAKIEAVNLSQHKHKKHNKKTWDIYKREKDEQ